MSRSLISTYYAEITRTMLFSSPETALLCDSNMRFVFMYSILHRTVAFLLSVIIRPRLPLAFYALFMNRFDICASSLYVLVSNWGSQK